MGISVTFLPILLKALQLVLALSVIVIIHELGHFSMARLFKVRVEKFYLFFDLKGKALFRYKSKRSGTEFGIGWFPMGGYCKIMGMVDEHYLATGKRSVPKPYEMRAKPAWQRFLIMIAGILFNLVSAVILYAGLVFYQGRYELKSADISSGMMFSPVAQEVGFHDNDIILTVDGEELDFLSDDFMKRLIESHNVVVQRADRKVVISMPSDMMQRLLATNEGMLSVQTPFVADTVFEGTPAATTGLQKGDRLLAIDTVKIYDISEAQRLFALAPGQPLPLCIARGNDTLRLSVTPDAQGRIGVGLASFAQVYPLKHYRYSFWESIPAGIQKAWHTLIGYADNMKYIFTREGANSMGGFISMGKLFSSTFSGVAFWSVVALLSVIFAFMNFLPVPMLDGAEILFLLVELVTRKKINDKLLMKTKMVGFIFLMFLLVWANLNDVIRLF